MSDLHPDAVVVTFETVLPPATGPGNQTAPYDFNRNPTLVGHMIAKIQNNVAQFGTIERFMEMAQRELEASRDAADSAVRVYEARRRQMEFLKEYALKNVTKKDTQLDG